MSGIENGGEFGQTLGHDRGEEHVPCRQEEWEFCFFSISISKSTQCILIIPLPGRQKGRKKKRKEKEHTKLSRMQHPFIKKNHTSRQTNPKPTQITQSANQKTKKKPPPFSPTPAKNPLQNETVVTIRNIKRRMQIRLGSRRAWHSSSSTSRRGRAINSRFAAFEFPILVATAASGHADVVFGRHDPVRACVCVARRERRGEGVRRGRSEREREGVSVMKKLLG